MLTYRSVFQLFCNCPYAFCMCFELLNSPHICVRDDDDGDMKSEEERKKGRKGENNFAFRLFVVRADL